MFQKLITKSYKFITLNRVRNFYFVKGMMNSDTGWFRIHFVKISGSNEVLLVSLVQ